MRWPAAGIVAAMLLWVGNASAQGGKRAITFADLMAMKRVSDPQISPSGKWVMFSVTEVSLPANSKVNHLWVVPLGGSGTTQADSSSSLRNNNTTGTERQTTFGDGEENGRFSPHGKTVSLSMKGQIFEAPWDEAAGKAGATIQVTNVSGGADGAIWSPDSKRLMFVVSVYPVCWSKTVSGWCDRWTHTNAYAGTGR